MDLRELDIRQIHVSPAQSRDYAYECLVISGIPLYHMILRLHTPLIRSVPVKTAF